MLKFKIRGMTISHTSYKKRQRDEEEREVEKYIQKKTEAYEISRDNLWKRNYLQNRFQYRMNLNCTHLMLLFDFIDTFKI
jgi:hypothetical protein